MPALRERLKEPGTYLLLLILLTGALLLDALRPPDQQMSAEGYVRLVQAYQRDASPGVSRVVQCRFSPTCSEYSLRAVRKFGIIRGMRLTANRLWRCRSDVPLSSADPVP